MSTKILVSKNNHFIFKHDGILTELPIGTYQYADTQNGPVLVKIDDIKIPEKIYSNDSIFIDHVLKSWNSITSQNLGIALVGGKGLGKSFTSNVILSKLNVPIIKISHNTTSFVDYLGQLKQDFAIFIDEFEKIYPTSDSSSDKEDDSSQEKLLSFLDGGIKRNNKIMFVITSNDEYKISSFMKNRPSRLRYFRRYNTLESSIIHEIIKDLLINQEYLSDLLETLPRYSLNIDSLIKIIEEINIHDKPYSSFKEFFNFKDDSTVTYTATLINEDESKEIITTTGRYIGGRDSIGKSKSLNTTIYSENYQDLNEIDKLGETIDGFYFKKDGTTDDDGDPNYVEQPVKIHIMINNKYLKSEYENIL